MSLQQTTSNILELRTTPRDVIETKMTKASYIASVLSAINSTTSDLDIEVRLLLAIDRRMSDRDMDETVKLAASHVDGGIVVGLDWNGDPRVRCFGSCYA